MDIATNIHIRLHVLLLRLLLLHTHQGPQRPQISAAADIRTMTPEVIRETNVEVERSMDTHSRACPARFVYNRVVIAISINTRNLQGIQAATTLPTTPGLQNHRDLLIGPLVAAITATTSDRNITELIINQVVIAIIMATIPTRIVPLLLDLPLVLLRRRHLVKLKMGILASLVFYRGSIAINIKINTVTNSRREVINCMTWGSTRRLPSIMELLRRYNLLPFKWVESMQFCMIVVLIVG